MSDWREAILAKVEEREARQQSPRKNAHITYPQVDHDFLKAAAEARGMGLGTYARAALYAFAAYDLGLDVDEMLGFLPQYDSDTGKLLGGAGGRRPDAKPTFGQWGITGLEGKHHGVRS
jgi:hypothetical protein